MSETLFDDGQSIRKVRIQRQGKKFLVKIDDQDEEIIVEAQRRGQGRLQLRYGDSPSLLKCVLAKEGVDRFVFVGGRIYKFKKLEKTIDTKIVEEETKNLGTFQNLVVLHNDRATGIKNGERVYGNIVTVRVVVSEDAVTAKAKHVPYEILEKISERITTELPTVVRCLYDLTHKPPATIEFE